MTPETQLARSLHSLADALTADAVRIRESLKHPAHAARLDPIRDAAKAVLARFFRQQRRLVLAELAPALRIVAAGNAAAGNANVREAAGSAEDDARAAVLLALQNGAKLPNAVTKKLAADFATVLESALAGGYVSLAAELAAAQGVTATMAAGSTTGGTVPGSAMQGLAVDISTLGDYATGGAGVIDRTISADATAAYLREHSLEKLADQIEATTVSRLQTALADAYEDGADYDGLVEAVRDEFADMADVRAKMIAQTGMNSAYNAGRLQLGRDLNFDLKSWSPDGTAACIVCEANVDQGWIALEDGFQSGDDAPPAHPNCDCSVDLKKSRKALAA